MSLKDIIERTHQKYSSPITKEILIRDLKELGINTNDHLIVHSALSQIGYIASGPLGVIESLQSIVSEEGSITMPTHSTTLTDPSYWENPPIPESWWEVYRQESSAFDPHSTPTEWMGAIPELFRTLKGVKRSHHPAHSFACWGKEKSDIIDHQALTDSMGMNSPLGKLYKKNAKILLLGVDHDSNTSLHVAESISGKVSREMQGAPMIVDGEREWVEFEELAYDSCDFLMIGREFEESHQIQKGTVGLATCKLMNMKEIVDYAVEWIKENRN